MCQLFQVLDVPLLNATEGVPLPNTTTPFFLQEVEVVEVVFEAMDNFYKFFSRYINHTVIVITAAQHIKDDVANVPTLAPICDFQVIAVLLTPFVIVKAKYAVGQVGFAFYFYTIIKSDKSSLLFNIIKNLLKHFVHSLWCPFVWSGLQHIQRRHYLFLVAARVLCFV